MGFENQTILSSPPLHGVPDSQNCPSLSADVSDREICHRCTPSHWPLLITNSGGGLSFRLPGPPNAEVQVLQSA